MKTGNWNVLLVLLVAPLFAFTLPGEGKLHSVTSPEKEDPITGEWARAMLDSMNVDEKIGQLFMIAAYSNKTEEHEKEIEKLILEQKIGGLIFMQGTPEKQIELVNRYQQAAKYPLLIAQDSEWGLNMRLDNTVKFPRNMTLGAIRNDFPIFELGMEIGRQCKKVGVQVNFAPVVDVNNNPNNPVINDRSYGENKYNVARKGSFFSRGMEYAGVIACAKHFPGHGDTDTDSHLDLPVINHNRARLDSVELYPFKKLIEAGVPAMMVAHLYIPALDKTPNLASTLSPKIVTGLLRKELGFGGLLFTDALGMKGVTKYFDNGEADLMALLAGNDVLLFSKDVPKAKGLIKKAIMDGRISMEDLNLHVLRILLSKEWSGLHLNRTTPTLSGGELQNPEALVLKKRLYRLAMTLVKNDSSLLPLEKLEKRKIASVEIGANAPTQFTNTLKLYAGVQAFQLPSTSDKAGRDKLIKSLGPFNTVIVGVGDMNKYAGKNFGIGDGTRELLKNLNESGKDVIVVLFGSPYALKYFGKENAILVAYESEDEAREAAAEAIFGAIRVEGILPVTASPQFPEGRSISLAGSGRLNIGKPESTGMHGGVLQRIDSIANDAIKMGATPGCAILVARGNTIVYNKAFGKTEYNAGEAVDPLHTLYDLASVTKIAATTLCAMHLTDKGKLNIEAPVSTYLPEFASPQLQHITVRNLLQHNAGFLSSIPFYQSTFEDDKRTQLRKDIYANSPGAEFCLPVAKGLYMCPTFQDSIWTKIVDSNVKTDQRVKYSDLSMIVMARVIEQVSGKSLNVLSDSLFFRPMGMNNTHFNPAICAPDKICAPTEQDDYWRNTKIQGFVHDQAAAMLGGCAGHAGLFSNIYDLAKVLFMVKNGGKYAENEFFSPEIVEKFTSRQLADSRKGLGWDKAEMDTTMSSPCSRYSSEATFGHTGFTGIGAWVDPKYDLIFIFLSNRTFPTAKNNKLINEGIRPKVMDVIYESIFEYNKGNEGI